MKYVIANWKANPNSEEESLVLAENTEKGLDGVGGVKVILCPPFPYLAVVRSVLRNSELGSQDISKYPGGPHTGEVTAKQLMDLKVKYAIIGHSERHENSSDISEKIKMAVENKIIPVLCLGSGLNSRDSEDKVRAVLRKQISALPNIEIKEIFFVYEPTWSISSEGGHRDPDGKHVADIIDFIKTLIDPEHVKSSHILYGGNVNSHNVTNFLSADGFLVGGASLDPHEFSQVIKALI